MATIDEYSIATVPIEMFFGSTFLALGTSFIWEGGGQYFLITNWHNVSGKNPHTDQHISKTAAEPNVIKGWFNKKGKLGTKLQKEMPLRNDDNDPVWWVHPKYGKAVDVVALPIATPNDVEMYPINKMDSLNLVVQVGMDVFLLGYPFGIGPSALPIWKRGSIASEPQVLDKDRPLILIDTASRPGMSGSPIIRRSWGSHMTETGQQIGQPTGTRIVGVYSGRLASNDPIEAQLGYCWPISLVEEIVVGKVIDN